VVFQNRILAALILLSAHFITFGQGINYLPKSSNQQVIHHKYYTLSYIDKYRNAEWVAYKITASMVVGDAKRAAKFTEDTLVVSGTATSKDFVHSGYDKGHLCPAADMKWSQEAMTETFFLSNIVMVQWETESPFRNNVDSLVNLSDSKVESITFSIA
jgi:endonuclease G